MRKLFLYLCFAVMFASGCAKPGLVGSYCGPLPEQNAVSAIAADAVDCLSALYPPGHTSLHLLQAKDAANGFTSAFETGLRAEGSLWPLPKPLMLLSWPTRWMNWTKKQPGICNCAFRMARHLLGRIRPTGSRKRARAARNRSSGAPSLTGPQKKLAMPGIPAWMPCSRG